MRGTAGRRILIALGAVSFLAGLVLMALGLFDYLGDGGSRAETADRSRTANDRVVVRPLPTTPPPTEAPDPTPAPPRVQDAAYRIFIERMGVDAPVQVYGLDENAVPIVPTEANTSDPAGVVAWYDFSAQPGRGSNAVFAGHVTWNGPAVFSDLDKLQPGDIIRLRVDDGTEMVYAVTDNFLVNAEDPEALKVMSGTPTDTITLITCDGAFVDTDDPVFGGYYTERRVVRATLQNITTAVGAPQAASGG